MWQTPKTDWVIGDTIPDPILVFNRIESNTLEITAVMASYFNAPTIVSKTWTISDFPFFDEINRIEGNIDSVKISMYEPPAWIPPVTTWVSKKGLAYLDLNRIEGNQLALYLLIQNIISYFKYSGQFYSGQDSTYL